LLEHSRIEAGEYFRASRLAAGLSVEQLAERSGIDSARIECFEDGQLAPGWKETALLFWVLGPLLPKPTPARRRAN
jgi:transcriptional regulator with XRE-family HTH domain